MSKGWWLKLFVTTFVTLLSIWTVVPTFLPANPNEGKVVQNKDGTVTPEQKSPWYYKIFPSNKIKLGLDLRGGISLTIGIDTKKALESEAGIYVEDLKRMLTKEGITVKEIGIEPKSSKIRLVLGDAQKRKNLLDFVRDKFRILEVVSEDNGLFVFDLTEDKKKEVEKFTVDQTLETERKRIDAFGVAEASIQISGSDRILIQLPGVSDASRAQSVLEKTALLEFKLVDGAMKSEDLKKIVEDALRDGKLKENYKPEELEVVFQGRIPSGTQVLFGEEQDQRTNETNRVFYLLKNNALLTGKFLEDARVQYGRFNEPVVGLSFNPGGAELFKKITTENVEQRLAIILDDKVNSAPKIDEPIPDGRAQVSFGGMTDRDSTLKQAKDLTIVLKAGALPAPIEILESRIVGPTLGSDSIGYGAKSALIGVIVVVIFMLIYYGFGGLFADLALILNLMFTLAMMIAIDATLTLPGIAGIALTLGIAVDANVLINERIREELLSGKPLRNAIAAGFKRSFLTIIDQHITTLIGGFVLLEYGTGPVRGFAVTLIIGLIISLYSAYAIVQLLFEYYLTHKKSDKMYI